MLVFFAGVVKLVDAPDSKSGSFGSVGSIPTLGTKENVKVVPINSKTRKLFGLAGFLLSNDVQRNAVSFTVTRNQSQKVTANRGILYGKTYP